MELTSEGVGAVGTTSGEPRQRTCGAGPLWGATTRSNSRVEFQFLDFTTLGHFSSRSNTGVDITARSSATRNVSHAFLASLRKSVCIGRREFIVRTCKADGEIGRDGGWDVGRCMLLAFFRDVSVPLASEAFGDPSLFRDGFFRASVCLGRPEGVFVPLEEVASFWSFSSSAFLRSSSLARSVSLSSELCTH
jgi:hypothetical protein